MLGFSESLIQNFRGLLDGAARFGDLPLHLARADFILRNATGFAGVGLDHRRGSGLQLARAPGGDQNIAIVAVEAFDQFHGFSPLAYRDARFRLPKVGALRSSPGKPRTALPIFPRNSSLRGLPPSNMVTED